MDKYFVTYDQALILREIGFNQPCFKIANSMGRVMWRSMEFNGKEYVDVEDIITRPITNPEFVGVPTYWQALSFLKEIGLTISYEDSSLNESLEQAIKIYYRSSESDLL